MKIIALILNFFSLVTRFSYLFFQSHAISSIKSLFRELHSCRCLNQQTSGYLNSFILFWGFLNFLLYSSSHFDYSVYQWLINKNFEKESSYISHSFFLISLPFIAYQSIVCGAEQLDLINHFIWAYLLLICWSSD